MLIDSLIDKKHPFGYKRKQMFETLQHIFFKMIIVSLTTITAFIICHSILTRFSIK